MFYGCIVSDKEEDKDKMMNSAIGLFESIARFPDKKKGDTKNCLWTLDCNFDKQDGENYY